MTETVQPPTSDPVNRGARMPRTARRAQLLAAARDVFAAQGYHAAAMDEIAVRAGVSKPVLYQHFPGKLELYRALVQTYTERLVSGVREAIGSTTDNHQRVRAAVAAYFDFVGTEGEAFRLVFETDLRGEGQIADVVNGAHDQCVDAIVAVVAEDAELTVDQARLIAVGLVGLSQVAARYWLDSGQRVDREGAIGLLSTLAWRGLAGFPLHPHGPAPTLPT